METDNLDPAALLAGLNRLAAAITPPGAAAGKDATGGHVESLTEAAMGITAALVQIAQAIDRLADSIADTD